MQKNIFGILSFLLFSILSGNASATEDKAWDIAVSIGQSSIFGVAPFSTSKKSIRQEAGYAFMASRKMSTHPFSFGPIETAVYTRAAYVLGTEVVSIGGRFGFHPYRKERLFTELRLGIGHPFGDFGGDVIRGRVRYFNQKRRILSTMLGLVLLSRLMQSKGDGLGLTSIIFQVAQDVGSWHCQNLTREETPG